MNQPVLQRFSSNTLTLLVAFLSQSGSVDNGLTMDGFGLAIHETAALTFSQSRNVCNLIMICLFMLQQISFWLLSIQMLQSKFKRCRFVSSKFRRSRFVSLSVICLISLFDYIILKDIYDARIGRKELAAEQASQRMQTQ